MSWDERILVVAPHADDETLGCGGLLASKTGARHVVVAAVGEWERFDGRVVTLAEREGELSDALAILSPRISHTVLTAEEGTLDAFGAQRLTTRLDREIASFRPTAVFLPYPSHHQDHRTLYHATLAALRPRPATAGVNLVAMFEYPFVALDPSAPTAGKLHYGFGVEAMRTKERAFACYRSQHADGGYLSTRRVVDWARSRGAEVDEPFAECFYLLRGRL